MRVFISHSSKDKPAVEALAAALRERGIEEVEAIADALLSRKAGPPPVRPPEHGRVERVLVTLEREGAGGVRVSLCIGEQEHGGASFPALPSALLEAQAEFLSDQFRTGLQRSPAAVKRNALDATMRKLGCELRALCLTGDAGEALVNLVDGCKVGTTIEVCFEAAETELLGLPFEALHLVEDRPLATQEPVVVYRRPAGLAAGDGDLLAGPLKILVAVGAPDERPGGPAILDQEHELQSILDAVEPAQRHENVAVRILEVGHPKEIAEALGRDAYHVLHLSCHGSPGALELEDEDGRPVRVTAAELLAPIRAAGKPLPLVLLNACHGGVQEGQTASLAEALLRAGVPGVLAMQTSVSDSYATKLAHAFYEHLALREPLLPSRALAAARKKLERARVAALQRPEAAPEQLQPEYATASLYIAGEERPLADFAREKEELKFRPVYDAPGPVPQLRIDDLIGRRKELRATLRTLRDESREYAGVVLTGIGGVGKSAVAGRAMQRLIEDGWMVPAHAGRFDLAAISGGDRRGAAHVQSRGAEEAR